MAARMHRARRLGGIVQPRRLVNGQRVHIGAQPDGFAGTVGLALDHTDDAGASDARDDLVAAKLCQLLCHQRRGPVGFKQDLRVLMNIAPPFGDFGQHLGV